MVSSIGSVTTNFFGRGILSESGDANGNGLGESWRVTINEIADDGVTLTFEMSGRREKSLRERSSFDTTRRPKSIYPTSRHW